MSLERGRRWPEKVPKDYKTRDQVRKELGITYFRFKNLVKEFLDGGMINSQGQLITAEDKGKAAYVSPELFDFLETAVGEMTEAKEGWLNSTELVEYIGCGQGTFQELLEELPAEVGEVDEESLTRERRMKVKHYSPKYADKLRDLYEYTRDSSDRTRSVKAPRERMSRKKEKFLEMSPEKNEDYKEELKKAIKLLEKKTQQNFPGADLEEVKEIKAQALETKLKLEKLLTSLLISKIDLNFEEKIKKVLGDVSYDLEAFEDLI